MWFVGWLPLLSFMVLMDETIWKIFCNQKTSKSNNRCRCVFLTAIKEVKEWRNNSSPYSNSLEKLATFFGVQNIAAKFKLPTEGLAQLNGHRKKIN